MKCIIVSERRAASGGGSRTTHLVRENSFAPKNSSIRIDSTGVYRGLSLQFFLPET